MVIRLTSVVKGDLCGADGDAWISKEIESSWDLIIHWTLSTMFSQHVQPTPIPLYLSIRHRKPYPRSAKKVLHMETTLVS